MFKRGTTIQVVILFLRQIKRIAIPQCLEFFLIANLVHLMGTAQAVQKALPSLIIMTAGAIT